MKEIQENYLNLIKNKYNNFTYYFYTYNNNINSDYEFKYNMLYLKGIESYNPGITTKTIKAFKIIKEKFDYDYIIRTNISTIINYKKLLKKIIKKNILYGGRKMKLRWLSLKVE